MPADQGPKADRHQLVADIEALKARHPRLRPEHRPGDTPEQQLIDRLRDTYAHRQAKIDLAPTEDGFVAWLARQIAAARAERDQAKRELEQARAERDQARLSRDHYRGQLDDTTSELEQVRRDLDAMTAVASSNKRHADTLAAIVDAVTELADSMRQRASAANPYPPGSEDLYDYAADLDRLVATTTPEPANDRYAAGWHAAVQALRDAQRYTTWWPTGADRYATGPVRRHLADYLQTIGPDEPQDDAGNRFPREPRDTTPPPQGDRIGAPDTGTQTGAEPAGPWEHTDSDGDTITIEPRLDPATGWQIIIGDEEAAVFVDRTTLASLHAWLSQHIGQPAATTPEPILAIPAGYSLTPGNALAINHLISAARAWRDARSRLVGGMTYHRACKALVNAVDQLTEEVPMGDK